MRRQVFGLRPKEPRSTLGALVGGFRAGGLRALYPGAGASVLASGTAWGVVRVAAGRRRAVLTRRSAASGSRLNPT